MMQSDAKMSGSGFLEFRLDFSETKNVAIGDLVSSDSISAGGHLWRIICYPRGQKSQNEDDKGYVSIFLKLISDSKAVKTIFQVFCLGRNGEPCFSIEWRFVKVLSHKCPEYPDGSPCWGWARFVKRSLLEPICDTDGRVTFLFSIIVLGADTIAVPPSNIGHDLVELLLVDAGVDVSFIVKGKTIRAHRAILAARSPVFRAQLFGTMSDATPPSITLQDIEPRVFKAMLVFMYTDELPEDEELREDGELGDSLTAMMQHLLAAADRYALGRLKLMCARKLWNIISVDTFASTVACDETHNCPELKSKCIDIFVVEKNFKKIVFTAGFMWLVWKFPDLAANLKERVGI